MSPGALSSLFHESMMALAVVGGPLMLLLLVTGLVLGVLQSATQIQDPAVGAVPRLLALLGLLVTMGPWMMERLAALVRLSLLKLAERGW